MFSFESFLPGCMLSSVFEPELRFDFKLVKEPQSRKQFGGRQPGAQLIRSSFSEQLSNMNVKSLTITQLYSLIIPARKSEKYFIKSLPYFFLLFLYSQVSVCAYLVPPTLPWSRLFSSQVLFCAPVVMSVLDEASHVPVVVCPSCAALFCEKVFELPDQLFVFNKAFSFFNLRVSLSFVCTLC